MKKLFLIGVFMLSIAGFAYATNQTATCPQDGETATFTGNKKADLQDPMNRSKDMCEYSHDHLVQDDKGTHTEKHTFWQNCGD